MSSDSGSSASVFGSAQYNLRVYDEGTESVAAELT